MKSHLNLIYLDNTELMAPHTDVLHPGWATLLPNSPHHVKTKKLSCSIENQNILKYTV
jgi:hypothetical protein